MTNDPNRRKFILDSLKSAGALHLLGRSAWSDHPDKPSKKDMTVQEIIDAILVAGALQPIPDTVDTIKHGKGDQRVSGIVTTMFPTIAVIEAAHKKSANFIIAHEPSFYNHRDDLHYVKSNRVLEQKLALLDKYDIAIWRFHDYCHSLKPDAIFYGVCKKMNWLPYMVNEDRLLTIPPLSLQDLAARLKTSLSANHVRVIGDLQHSCSKIALLPGASGGQTQISMAENLQPDVLIVGEVSEWETAEYVRDSHLLGGNTALIILGHTISEEPGMEWVADWLKPIVPGIPIQHIPSNDPFTWL